MFLTCCPFFSVGRNYGHPAGGGIFGGHLDELRHFVNFSLCFDRCFPRQLTLSRFRYRLLSKVPFFRPRGQLPLHLGETRFARKEAREVLCRWRHWSRHISDVMIIKQPNSPVYPHFLQPFTFSSNCITFAAGSGSMSSSTKKKKGTTKASAGSTSAPAWVLAPESFTCPDSSLSSSSSKPN